MKIFTDYLTMNTKERKILVPITEKVEAFMKQSGINEGLFLIQI